MAENLSVILHGVEALGLENRQFPTPAEDQVLVRIACVGICGTDLSLWKKGQLGTMKVEQPLVLGHEASGIVEKVGRGVLHLKEGDHVAIEPLIICQHCANCKLGKYNICENLRISGIPHEDGNMCRYKVHPADFCHKLPDDIPLDEGALCEPLAVAIHACLRAEITLGHSVFIIGAGPVGLLAVAAAKAMGASRIIVSDMIKSRLDVAKELGACNTLLSDPLQGGCGEIADKLADALGRAPDVTIECSGSESGISLAIDATKRGGKVVLVGLGSERVNIPVLNAIYRQVDILPVWLYASNCFPAAVALLESRAFDLTRIITHYYAMEEIQDAFDTLVSNAEGAIKVIIQCEASNSLEHRRGSTAGNLLDVRRGSTAAMFQVGSFPERRGSIVGDLLDAATGRRGSTASALKEIRRSSVAVANNLQELKRAFGMSNLLELRRGSAVPNIAVTSSSPPPAPDSSS